MYLPRHTCVQVWCLVLEPEVRASGAAAHRVHGPRSPVLETFQAELHFNAKSPIMSTVRDVLPVPRIIICAGPMHPNKKNMNFMMIYLGEREVASFQFHDLQIRACNTEYNIHGNGKSRLLVTLHCSRSTQVPY